MSVRKSPIVALIALSSCLSGCTSVSSVVVDQSKPIGDGIAYYMPSRPIKVTVTVDDKGVQTPSVDPADTVPDPRHRFVLFYERNLVGTNHLALGVTTSGLLTSSNSDVTSGVITIAKNLATAAGDVSALLGGAAPKAAQPKISVEKCENGRSYTRLYFPERAKTDQIICNFRISIALLGGTPLAPPDKLSTERLSEQQSQSGLFYRHDQPYLVTITDIKTNVQSQFMALSPDESEIGFVPVTRSLFANNRVNITLSNGIVTSVDQTSDGELVALSELPADILSAYFAAIGNMFNAFSTNSTAQTTAITKAQDLSLAKINAQACAAVIAANPIAGKSPADQQTAVTTIKAACATQ